MNDLYIFLITFLVALLVNYLPYVSKIYRVINTLFHESAHAFMALFANAEVVKINLFSDSSGVALTKSKYWLSKFLVSITGYFGASFSGYFLLSYFLRNELVVVFFSLVLLAVVNLVFWVRNMYGIFWLLIFTTVLILSHLYLPFFYNRLVLLFFIFSIVINAVTSTFTLFYISIKNSKQAGDAANLKQFTFIPAFVWATLFLLFSVYIFYLEILLIKPLIKSIM